ncbi:hypothetical protein J1N35_014060 [Gossypium stocksii]|uniref:Integrase catalytic domain-containing protein n=1 Tax=Gossypium stocksii TaxID=47602 RepID=A0A9D3VW94_9ROSI|nr:hypothetical protein J1N35_014060 [Gossypium stocksii]
MFGNIASALLWPAMSMPVPTMSTQPGWFFPPTQVPTWTNLFTTPSSQHVHTPIPATPSSQVFIATPNSVSDNTWYPDSGATHHLTNSTTSLTDSTSYKGHGNTWDNQVMFEFFPKGCQLVVADVWGPAPIFANGFRYYVAFTDACTRYTWLYFLRKKSEVVSIFPVFHRLVERMLGCKLLELQTDGGGEFQGLRWYLAQQGIMHRITCPYTSA